MYEDDGCMLLPDTKWDRKDASALYTLAILKDSAIRSVRDLTGAHVPMLRALRDGVLAELRKRFGVRPDQLRCYMHYLPSFWHAHIHFAGARAAASAPPPHRRARCPPAQPPALPRPPAVPPPPQR